MREPIAWLTGVWLLDGRDQRGDMIWTSQRDGTMVGMLRQREPVFDLRFYSLREEEHGVTLVELTEAGTSTVFQAVERGEGFVVFEDADRGRLTFSLTSPVAFEIVRHRDAGMPERLALRLKI